MASADRPVSCRLCGLAAVEGVPAPEDNGLTLSERCLLMMDTKLAQEKGEICQNCQKSATFEDLNSSTIGRGEIFSSPRAFREDEREHFSPFNQPHSQDPNKQPSTSENSINQKFKCNFCPRSFSLKTNRNDHVTTCHADIKIFRCNMCLIFFNNKEREVEHMRTIHRDHLDCYLCPTSFETYDNKVIHLKVNHREEATRLKCNNIHCKKMYFWSPKELGEHVRLVHLHTKGLTKCFFCDKRVPSLHLHVLQFHKDVAIKCNYSKNCLTYFQTEEEMQRHVRERHNIQVLQRDFRSWCVFCGERLTKKQFADHLENLHSFESIKYDFSDKDDSLCDVEEVQKEAEVTEEPKEVNIEVICLDDS